MKSLGKNIMNINKIALTSVASILCMALIACGGSASSNVSTPPPGGGTPQNTFFALNMGPATPWPDSLGVKFGIWRSLGGRMRWSDLQPTKPSAPTSDPTDPSYNWKTLDTYFAAATSNGQQILFTAYYTPQWASQQPDATCQENDTGGQTAGGCYPPIDVETGDNYWKDFLTALYAHVKANGQHISTYECWNEPDIASEYYSASPQALSDLNTMCVDLRATISALDSTAKFTTPAPTGGTNFGAQNGITWMQTWISNGYANSADIIAFHGYVCTKTSGCTASSAELIASAVVAPLQNMINTTAGTPNVSSKPLWDTEGSDDVGSEPISDPDLHAAFLARFSLLQQSAGVATFAYWGWNFGNGISLLDLTTNNLNPAGIAWQQLYTWTVGSTYTSGCAATTGTVYTCALNDSNGNPELIVWDSQNVNSCSNDICGSTSFTIPSGTSFTKCTDLAGNACTSGISGGAVNVGAKPVLLQ